MLEGGNAAVFTAGVMRAFVWVCVWDCVKTNNSNRFPMDSAVIHIPKQWFSIIMGQRKIPSRGT